VGYRADVHVDRAELHEALADDVRRGLGGRPRSLPPKYFYDATGSALFEMITRLPEYYLTRAEHALLDAHAFGILREAHPMEVVELGAGSPAKFRRLLAAMNGTGGVRRYVPVDVDGGVLADSARALLREHPALDIHAVVGDFERHLDRVPPAAGRRLVAFLGSTIGNLDPPARQRLLVQTRRLLGPDDRLLLGLDLVKNLAALHAAYADPAGVTAQFNRNILRVVNRELHADFRPAAFRHEARWNDAATRVEMHLAAEARQTAMVRDLDMTIAVERGETIWTESCHKFTRVSAETMLASAGLAPVSWHTDGVYALAVAATR
jgi:L-histidine N-alpha-methyltransferase